jgi:hypothetical protein
MEPVYEKYGWGARIKYLKKFKANLPLFTLKMIGNVPIAQISKSTRFYQGGVVIETFKVAKYPNETAIFDLRVSLSPYDVLPPNNGKRQLRAERCRPSGSIDAPLSGRDDFRDSDRIQPNGSSLNLDDDRGTLSKSKGVVNRLQYFLGFDP